MSRILSINGGSSSIRFALYQTGESLTRMLSGQIERIGSDGTQLSFTDAESDPPQSGHLAVPDHTVAAAFLIDWLQQRGAMNGLQAVGHRVVHGMNHAGPAPVTPELLAELRGRRAYDPDHLPREIELIEAFDRHHAQLPQLVCFDTSFHHDMPQVARLLAIPRRFERKGMRRYGFHGLSYAYLLEALVRLKDPAATKGRVILAHLGSGASLAAVRDGKSIDTSMSFTPTSGLPMSTRSGDLDPGVVNFLAHSESMTTAQFDRMVNHESGLLGVSETSADVRDLLVREADDPRAAEALALFCYQAKKWIGAYAAALGGLDTLVFAGGIGENAPVIRARICDDLGFLGIELDPDRNANSAALISPDRGRVPVRVIATDEAWMIAQSVAAHFSLGSTQTTT